MGPIFVVIYSLCFALLGECINWFFIYRSPKFQTLKKNIELHHAKLEQAKSPDASGSQQQPKGSKAAQKRQDRIQPWKEEASKQLMANQFKTSVIMVATLIASYKFLNKFFDPVPIATLPFEPHAFIMKATHRGLPEGTDPYLCSPTFIFVLCQGSIKVILTKLLGWGPSREMANVKPYVPKAVQAETDAMLGTLKKDR